MLIIQQTQALVPKLSRTNEILYVMPRFYLAFMLHKLFLVEPKTNNLYNPINSETIRLMKNGARMINKIRDCKVDIIMPPLQLS